MIPGSGAGVYTIWDDEGGLVYAGIAGKGLASRLLTSFGFRFVAVDDYSTRDASRKRDQEWTARCRTTAAQPLAASSYRRVIHEVRSLGERRAGAG